MRNLEEFLKHNLPTQGAIQDFIHHNPLHAFQDRTFADAIAWAGAWTGGQGFWDRREYLRRFEVGQIAPESVGRALRQLRPRVSLESFLDQQRGLSLDSEIIRFRTRSIWGREALNRLEVFILPNLFRLLGHYCDQGLAIWEIPHRHEPWWSCLQNLILESKIPHLWLNHPWVRETLSLPPEKALERLTLKLFGSSLNAHDAHETLFPYILESLLEHPGWSGLIAMTTTKPKSFPRSRPIPLLDFVATKLLCEAEAILCNPSNRTANLPVRLPRDHTVKQLDGLEVWHAAYEWEYFHSILTKLKVPPEQDAVAPTRPHAQFILCIDDRECSLRRHLEAQNPGIETFAAAGFFGMDFLFRKWNQATPDARCPAHLAPAHLVEEELKHPPTPNTAPRWSFWNPGFFLGPWQLFKLMLHLWWSPIVHAQAEPQTRLKLFRDPSRPHTPEAWKAGFTVEELAQRVGGILKGTGFLGPFAPWVIVLGHGSQTSNNPHFAAYDCGACSGRPGGPNARAFALAANHPKVRELLRAQGIEIPNDTVFVGAQHNTTADDVTFYDDDLDDAFPDTVRNWIQTALDLNAKERTKRFELVSAKLTPSAARHAVRRRAFALFEPRPELNHATNALAIVGRRSLTKDLFLDRRAFLHSYDPRVDAEGILLESILSAVIPVCGGINLEYFFSRMDPNVFGAGSKLPHNVTGLIGVSNGVDSDLVNGLPTQMTEVHDPYRLLVVVEHRPEIARRAIERRPALKEWVDGKWVHYASIDPNDGITRIWVPTEAQGQWIALKEFV